MEVSPRRGRPRRELFVDAKKEIAKSQIRENFLSTDNTCRKCLLVQPSLKDTPARLFKTPGSQGVSRNPIFRQLWERNCVMEETDAIEMPWDVLQHGDKVLRRARREESLEESSSQDEGGMRPDVGLFMEDIPEDMEQAVRETPSMEKVRETSLSRSRTPQLSPLQVGQSPMDESPLDRTGTRGQADRSREGSRRTRSGDRASTSSAEAHSPLHTGGSRLAVLLEEMEEMQLSPPDMPPLHVPEEFSSPEARFIRQHEEEGAETYFTFRDMCPPRVNTRPRAAKCLYALLERCSQGTLFVRQHKPYGDIYISASPRTLPHSP